MKRTPLCITPAVSLPGYGNDALDAMELPRKDKKGEVVSRYLKIPSPLFDTPKRPRTISGINTHLEALVSDPISELVFARFHQPDARNWARETLARKVAEGEDPRWAERLAAHDWWTAHADEVAVEMQAMICLLDLDSHH